MHEDTQHAGAVLAGLVSDSDELLLEADLVEAWYGERAVYIRDAHARGMTVEEFEDAIEEAIAWEESGRTYGIDGRWADA